METATTTVLAWHFLKDNKLRDGTAAPPDGEWLEHDGECVMCESGLHASRKLLDAVQHAPGDTLCRVECDEVSEEQVDKFVCRRRKILWRMDADEVLRAFARRCALDFIDQLDAPAFVREFLETGVESERAAARDAARDAAWAAAWAAARAADGDADWTAARGAALVKYGTWLEEMVEEARLRGERIEA